MTLLTESDKAILVRMLRVMFPHDRISDAPYERTADAVFDAAQKSAGPKVSLTTGLDDLAKARFFDLGETEATALLKAIEETAFFRLVLLTAVVAFYNDAEVWEALGYEGASYDKGGYINRGFDDLDWLPEPRVAQA
jgi:hypothetical protein